MVPEFSGYKQAVDELMAGGFSESQTDALMEYTERSISGLRAEMRAGFQAVNERFEKIEARIDHLQTRIDQLQTSFHQSIDSLKNWLIGGMGAIVLTLISAILTMAFKL